MTLQLDPAFTAVERQVIQSDYQYLKSMKLKLEDGKLFSQVFGGIQTDAVLRYLDERVHYLIRSDTDLDENTFWDSLSPGYPGYEDVTVMHAQRMPVANNVGTQLWFLKLTRPGYQMTFSFGGKSIDVDSTRIGIVQLDEGYSALIREDSRNHLQNSLQRITTLIHEARHSDCTGGIYEEDLKLLAQGDYRPRRTKCGHTHRVCASGHPYEGLSACDDHLWGSYSVEAVFTGALQKGCKDCSEEELAIARIMTQDAISRIPMWRDRLKPEAPLPDMSSSNQVIPK